MTPEAENPSNDYNIGNDIEPPFKHLPYMEVTDEAERLAARFKNLGWTAFYAKTIMWLGIKRVNFIEARVRDSAYPERLFTKIAKQEIEGTKKRLTAEKRVAELRKRHGSI